MSGTTNEYVVFLVAFSKKVSIIQGLQSNLTQKEPMLCKNKSTFQFDFFLLKELYMMFFVSKFHGTGSISLGDNLF